MRYRELAWGAFAGAIALCAVPACGGSDDDDVIIVKKDAGKDSGSGGKDAGKDSSSGGSGGVAGSAGTAGGGTAGAAGSGGVAGSGNGGSAGGGGTAGSQADASTGGGGGTGGTDAGKCEDNASTEPNNNEGTASAAAAAACGAAGKEQTGVIAGADSDWYKYTGSAPPLCTPAPTVKVDHPSLRACVYLECNSGSTTVTCAQGATATSPDGLKGCCANGGNEAEATVACGITLNNGFSVEMRVDQSPASPAACFAYKLSYSL